MERSPLVALLAVIAGSAPVHGQRELVSQTVGDHTRYEAERASVYFETGEFTAAEMERFVRLVDRGIGDIEMYLKDGTQQKVGEAPKITYHVRGNIPMSRSFRRTVLLPAERVKQDAAPYLHETTHVLMRTRSDCMWLSEGFASFVQSHVAEHMGGYDGYVFSWGGNANVDRLARRYLTRDTGRAVLPFVAGEGNPSEVWEERRQVAAPFYVLSHSFVKHLVEHASLSAVKEMAQADDAAAVLERLTKRSLAGWKADWLTSLENGAELTRGR